MTDSFALHSFTHLESEAEFHSDVPHLLPPVGQTHRRGIRQGAQWYRNQALPCRLVIHQQQWPSDLFAGNDLGGERREELREDWQEGKMLIRHRSQRAAPCQAKPPPV